MNLVGDFLKRINIGIKKKSREIVAKWITKKYEYLPKYCKNFKLQEHNENECFILHPILYPEGGERKQRKVHQEACSAKKIKGQRRKRQ